MRFDFLDCVAKAEVCGEELVADWDIDILALRF